MLSIRNAMPRLPFPEAETSITPTVSSGGAKSQKRVSR